MSAPNVVVPKLSDTDRIRFLCWLARERGFGVEHDAAEVEPISLHTNRMTVGTGVTFADATDAAAVFFGWPDV